MAIVLQVLGALTLLFFAFVVVVVLVSIFKLKKLAKQFEGMAKDFAGSQVPARLHLIPMAAPSWENPEGIAGQTESLPALGFSLGGTFQVEEVPGLTIQAWFQPQKAVTAVVYEHPRAGVFTDMFTRYQDGTRATFVNTSQGEGVDHAPGHSVERFPNLNTRELYERFLDCRPDRPAVIPSAEAFVERFEQAYADEMDWRNSRGGSTEDEIRRVAQLTGRPIDDETLAGVRSMAQERAAVQLDEAVRERFLAETTLPAAEWEKIRDHLIIIHDVMSQSSFVEALSRSMGDEDDSNGEDAPRLDATPENSARRLFEEHNQKLADVLRCKKIGAVHAPVEADVYVLPAGF